MKLQQLRYIVEVANNDLNVSLTAEKLYTSQPGISKQIKQLENELGIRIFNRSGKHLSDITPIGEKIITIAREILNRTQDIKTVVQEHTKPNLGVLSIATTYTQARYALPLVIQKFMQDYSSIALKMEQGDAAQCLTKLRDHVVDFAVISDLNNLASDMIALPCYHWNQSVILPKQHPLSASLLLSIDELAKYPLISYDLSNEGSDIYQVFSRHGKKPNIVFNTADADLIKTYVRLGTGVGIIAKMAFDNQNDTDLVMLNAGHIFPYNTSYIVFLRSLYIRSYMYDFIYQFSSYLDKKMIHQALNYENNAQVQAMFNGVKLPVK